ncbi:MAG: PKD domain-containing protein [Thermoplasmata archaeon]|nr:PKD domain-containing protein [Thermoplasmata archaeon]
MPRELAKFLPGLITGAIIVVCIAALIFFSVRGDDPPEARIYISSAVVEVNQPVNLNANNSFDPEGEDLTYEWEIGGHVWSDLVNLTYSFPGPGNYTVILTVKDPSGNTDTATVLVDVISGE